MSRNTFDLTFCNQLMEEAYLAFPAVGNGGQFSARGMDHSRVHRNALGDNLDDKTSLRIRMKGTIHI